MEETVGHYFKRNKPDPKGQVTDHLNHCENLSLRIHLPTLPTQQGTSGAAPQKLSCSQIFGATPREATVRHDSESALCKEGKDGEKGRGLQGSKVGGAAAMEPHLEGGQPEDCRLPRPYHLLCGVPCSLIGEGISKNGGWGTDRMHRLQVKCRSLC